MAVLNLTCPISGSRNCHVFLEIRDVPVLSNVLCDSKEESLSVPRGDLILAFCEDSGHVFNAAFDGTLVDYSARYENSLHHSARFQQFANNLTNHLISEHGIRGKHVVDVGCGDGEFLRLLCERGGNTGLGFDPSYDAVPTVAGSFSIVPDTFSEDKLKSPPALITCRHVLEHIEEPANFLATIRKAAISNPGAVVYVEVPNFGYTLHELAIWDLIYEHVSYFTSQSLAHLFHAAGFDILKISTHYGRQFLGIEATAGAGQTGDAVPAQVDTTRSSDVSSFKRRYTETVERWRQAVEELRHEGQRAVVWGAGSKGVTLLNVLQAPDVFAYAVDINPRKHGKFVAGAGQEIVPPESLSAINPDVVVIMNDLYENEIRATLRGLGIEPQIKMV